MVAGRGRTGAWCAQRNNAGQWLQVSINWLTLARLCLNASAVKTLLKNSLKIAGAASAI